MLLDLRCLEAGSNPYVPSQVTIVYFKKTVKNMLVRLVHRVEVRATAAAPVILFNSFDCTITIQILSFIYNDIGTYHMI